MEDPGRGSIVIPVCPSVLEETPRRHTADGSWSIGEPIGMQWIS
jgi:hypothetical protein